MSQIPCSYIYTIEGKGQLVVQCDKHNVVSHETQPSHIAQGWTLPVFQ